MNEAINKIINDIINLEKELETLVNAHQKELFYTIKGAKIEFEKKILAQQKALRISLVQWLKASRIQSILSIPFIYGMVIPLSFMHLTIEIFQAICFPLYSIPKVKRSDYFIADRHQLPYLNIIEKFNCAYCGYGNAVIAYTREIIGRTELYWCPIKHAKKAIGTHKYYRHFLDFGEYDDFHQKTTELRSTLSEVDK